MSAIPAYFWILAVALGAIPLFLLTLKLVSLLGWIPWAKENPAPQDIAPLEIPTSFFFMNGTFSWWLGYNNCLRVKLSEQGIFIRPIPPFCVFHPWLFLPWLTLHSSKRKTFCIALEFRSPSGSRFRLVLPHSVASKLPLALKPTENA